VDPRDVPEHVVGQVRRLHDAIDTSTRRLEVLHAPRLRCTRGCASCCVDDLTVSMAEAARILRDGASAIRAAPEGPRGACAMLLPDGACRIYAARPYVCRTQGLPLRWTEEGDVERRDICPLNDDDPTQTPLEELAAEKCWTLGAVERALALVDDLAGGTRVRCSLRDLVAVAKLGASLSEAAPNVDVASKMDPTEK
jgi:Fe-S-cluster containining protein